MKVFCKYNVNSKVKEGEEDKTTGAKKYCVFYYYRPDHMTDKRHKLMVHNVKHILEVVNRMSILVELKFIFQMLFLNDIALLKTNISCELLKNFF